MKDAQKRERSRKVYHGNWGQRGSKEEAGHEVRRSETVVIRKNATALDLLVATVPKINFREARNRL